MDGITSGRVIKLNACFENSVKQKARYFLLNTQSYTSFIVSGIRLLLEQLNNSQKPTTVCYAWVSCVPSCRAKGQTVSRWEIAFVSYIAYMLYNCNIMQQFVLL